MRTVLVEKRQVTDDVYTFYFKKPPGFTFLAGQYIYLSLPYQIEDPRGNTRQFTLSSSPTEQLLAITTNVNTGSLFKKKLIKLNIGDEIIIDGPHGVLFWEDGLGQNHLFIAGGLGITPFRSILKFLEDKNISLQTMLVHLNNTNIFKQELINYKSLDYNLLSENDYEKLELLLNNFSDHTVYWVVGPSSMVKRVEKMLEARGTISEYIRVEKFTGY